MFSDFEAIKKYLDSNGIPYCSGIKMRGIDEMLYIAVNPKSEILNFGAYYNDDELGYEWAITIEEYCRHDTIACVYGTLMNAMDFDYEDPMGCEILSSNGNGFYELIMQRIERKI